MALGATGSFSSLGSDANFTVPISEIIVLEKRKRNKLLWNKIINASVIPKSISYLVQSLFSFTKMHADVRRQ